jgi:hemerythrin
MKKFAYPRLTKHHNYHSNFIYKVAIYNSELLSTNPPDPIEIIDFLKKWWKNHISIIDKDYKAYKDKIQSDASYD